MDGYEAAQAALDNARKEGAEYADVRYENIADESLSVTNGTIEPIENSVSRGIGIRVIKNGAWGFAATDNLSEKNIAEKAKLACRIAEASAMVNNKPVALSEVKPADGEYLSPHEIDPFEIPLKQKIDSLMELDKAMAEKGREYITNRNCFASFRKRYKILIASNGADIRQTLIQTGAGMDMSKTLSHRNRFSRSYPTASGQYECKGYELLAELRMPEAVERMVEEIKMLESAEDCPVKDTTLLISGDQVSLQMHESIGHPLELDRVFGAERNFSGVSFATTDKLNKLKYGSEIVSVMCDPTTPHSLASYGWDDEGVPAEPRPLIKDGILVDYLSSRETSQRIGKNSTAACRANSWANVPIVRISTINLQPGDKSFDQLLSEIDEGIYMDGVRSWSIDDERRYFKFGCEIGWLIEGGKLTRAVKNPTYSGCTTDFWNNCTGIANRDHYRIWGTPNCGKGQPGQNARTAQGASPARFENVRIGE